MLSKALPPAGSSVVFCAELVAAGPSPGGPFRFLRLLAPPHTPRVDSSPDLMPTKTNPFWKLFKAKCCSIALKTTTKEDTFKELVGILAKSGELPKELEESAFNALVERDELASTGLGMGVAIPHVKLKGLEQAVVSLAVHKEGLDWNAIDGESVHLLFTVLRPERAGDLHDPERHLEMMRWIARLSRAEDFRRFAKNASTKKELVDLLKEMAKA